MNKSIIGIIAAGAILASLPAIAQQPAPKGSDSGAPAATPAAPATKPLATTPAAPATAKAPVVAKAAPVVIPRGVFVNGQLPGQDLAKDRLIGAKVQNKDGQVIGDIEDLLINRFNGQVQGVIMGTGGFLGVGEKKIGVALNALQFTQKDGKTVVSLPSATKEVLTALPAFKRAEPPKGIIDRTKEKAKELSDKTKETAKDAAAAVKEKTGPAIEKAKDAAGAAVDKAKEAVKPAEKK